MKPGTAWLGPDTPGEREREKTPFQFRLANTSRAMLASHAKRVRDS